MIGWLNSLQSKGWILGLERIERLLDALGNPQNDLKTIHVAGSNGKGSVCAMIASILSAQGYKTGLYTSPHLSSFNERFQINDKNISDERINSLLEKIKKRYTDQSYFEVVTALAFLYFKEENVDVAIIEVGLGGRCDATNVITPLVSIITNISLEHTDYLGETEQKIAYEKAGIIKETIPVITLAKGDALKEIKKIAKQRKAPLHIPKKARVDLNLRGEFQQSNVALALKAIDIISKEFAISDESIERGLESISLRGRFEFIEKNVLVDCAHNPDAINILSKEITKIRNDYEKIIAVVGILKDKDSKHMIEQLDPLVDYFVFCKPDSNRAHDPLDLQSFTKKPSEVVQSPKAALKKAKKVAYPQDLVLVCGSIYTVGEII